ncbi:MAG: NUMOD3 domain-containing DNA-binding protein [Campylobacterota bacterium]|nr:NUMOD3 domain-containing DNA-binding protein [Campylobacterota bacterium]
MKNKVTLYIATHNKTGLKYFGKTTKYFTKQDLQSKYHGSGTYWKSHLKKHGDDVTMEIYGIYSLDENAEDYVLPIALKFSGENNIVEDYDNWANINPENGLDGGDNSKYIDYTNISIKLKGRKHSEITKLKQSLNKIGEKNPFYGSVHSEESKSKISLKNKGANNGMFGKKHNDETKDKMKEKRKLQIPPSLGKIWTEEEKKKLMKPKGPQVKLTCPYCNKEGGASNMKRYHFENCKIKSLLEI